MISVTLGGLIAIYVAAFVAAVLGWWMLRHWARARQCRRWHSRLVQCALCGTVYEAEITEALSSCPHCRHRNERVPRPSV